MVTNENIKYQFSYFYKKILGREYIYTDRDEKLLNNFSKLLYKRYQESIGESWLFDFILFQMNKFCLANTKMSLQLNWIFGKKALESWKERNTEHLEYFTDQFRERFNIKRSDIVEVNFKEPILEEYFSRERNRFKNKYRKYLHCRDLKLFNEKSVDCRFCKMKKNCSNGIYNEL